MAADPKSAVNGKPKYSNGQPWRVENSLDLYHVNAWGEGYFGVNERGHATVTPSLDDPVTIDLHDVVEELLDEGVRFPALIRFQDLLKTRVVKLNEAFRTAREEAGSLEEQPLDLPGEPDLDLVEA